MDSTTRSKKKAKSCKGSVHGASSLNIMNSNKVDDDPCSTDIPMSQSLDTIRGNRKQSPKESSENNNTVVEISFDIEKSGMENPEPESLGLVIHKSDSEQSTDNICRICHDNPSDLKLIQPCSCKGTMGLVHQDCLEHWLGESGKTSCEICGIEYVIQRKPKYTGISSVFSWIRNPTSPNDTKNLFFDLACFFVLTPLASISAWLCVLGSQHYSMTPQRHLQTTGLNKNRLEEPSNSRWTSIGLLTLTVTLLSAYYIWLFVAFKYHYNVWKTWQGRNFIVTVLPFEQHEVSINTDASNIDTKKETILSIDLPVDSDQPSARSSETDHTLSSLVVQIPMNEFEHNNKEGEMSSRNE